VRLTVFGGCGAWPAAGQACGGYLVEHDGFRWPVAVASPGLVAATGTRVR
jgi:hypothetical protein